MAVRAALMARYVTKTEMRSFAEKIPLNEQRERVAKASLRANTHSTVFLSHSSKDKKEVPGAMTLLTNKGGLVYIDEIDPTMPPYTSDLTAKKLKKNIKEVDSITNKLHWLKMDSLQNNEYLILFWFLIEIIKIVSLSEISTFHAVVDKIGSSRKAIEQLYLFIGELDMAISIASLRAGLPYYSQATFLSNQKELQVQSLYHPLVENCVANELHLKGKSLLLTGSNMSGKSTFIKAINLNLIAAQTINTSFTKAYTAPILGIATSIEISDDITSAKSYYMEEVETIGNLMELSNKPNSQFLFTIDEVFKGTNTIERISAAKAILSFLNQKQHLVLVSTHDIELTELLDEYYDLYYFQESIENQNLSFDYTLKQGALKKKNAIAILELAGYPPTVIQEAKSIANKFEKEKLLYKKDI